MLYVDGPVQEKPNSSALAMELHLSYSNPSMFSCVLAPANFAHILYWSVTILRYLSKTHLKLRAHEILLIRNIHFSGLIILKFCTEQ